MRLVLDTNVVTSALLWRGIPYQLLQTIRRRSNLKRQDPVLKMRDFH
jgi:predicted nucleic acid-binding protein